MQIFKLKIYLFFVFLFFTFYFYGFYLYVSIFFTTFAVDIVTFISMTFSFQDIQQLSAHGISLADAELQMEHFRTGFPPLNIVAPASTHRGIRVLHRADADVYRDRWLAYLASGHSAIKFVPASGAASRMFKDLFRYLDDGVETDFVRTFLAGKDRFAFGPELQGLSGQDAVRHLLEDMRYGYLPKGLLLFHSYRDGARTAAEEHLVEAAQYTASDGIARVHFTVSPEHLALFRHHMAAVMGKYERKYGVRFDISFSVQKPETDTLAANPDGTPFRQDDGSLLFRPGGHGALIRNLGELDADVVFVKNIDNVVPDRFKRETIYWKQVLAGVLVEEQERVYARLRDSDISDEERQLLNRPIRVCGVVRNTGEPGGGPFLVKDEQGRVSGQILESSQIADVALMQRSTHFNPVDLVCSFRDEQGNRYSLADFVDPLTGFISHKSVSSRELLALELPGLWNGAMARWNTLFVQVPGVTFHPVKTVNDLLRHEHQ